MFNQYKNSSQAIKNERNYAFNTISDMIKKATKNLNTNMTQREVDMWFDYSQSMLELVLPTTPGIYLNYKNFIYKINLKDVEPYLKYQASVEYLMEILRVLLNE